MRRKAKAEEEAAKKEKTLDTIPLEISFLYEFLPLLIIFLKRVFL